MNTEKEQQPREHERGISPGKKKGFDPKALLESGFDFEGFNRKLMELCNGQAYGRSPTEQVLDKVEPALIHARKAGMSISQLHRFLAANEIRVSKPTLRTYLAGKLGKTRRETVRKPKVKTAVPNPAAAEENQRAASQNAKARSPRIRRKEAE